MIKDYTSVTFGNLTGLYNTYRKDTRGYYIWMWKCSCGNNVERSTHHVPYQGGNCDICVKIKASSRNKSHGMTNSCEFKSWTSIKKRCYDKNSVAYKSYGGVGLTFDYKDSFLDFIDEVGLQPKDGKRYTIDRIDNNKGYVKGNMRWATYAKQAKNKSLNSRNSTGYTGVCLLNSKGKLTYGVTWVDLENKKHCKIFTVSKYGLLESFALACAYRDMIISELNSKGAGYTENHGKIKLLFNN